MRRTAFFGAAVAALLAPAAADAHGLVQRANLPLPEWLFGWAAALVLVVSFAALGMLWSRPRLETDAWRPLPFGIGKRSRLDRRSRSRAARSACCCS